MLLAKEPKFEKKLYPLLKFLGNQVQVFLQLSLNQLYGWPNNRFAPYRGRSPTAEGYRRALRRDYYVFFLLGS